MAGAPSLICLSKSDLCQEPPHIPYLIKVLPDLLHSKLILCSHTHATLGLPLSPAAGCLTSELFVQVSLAPVRIRLADYHMGFQEPKCESCSVLVTDTALDSLPNEIGNGINNLQLTFFNFPEQQKTYFLQEDYFVKTNWNASY